MTYSYGKMKRTERIGGFYHVGCLPVRNKRYDATAKEGVDCSDDAL